MRASGGGGGGGGGGLRSHEARRDEACGEERRDGTNNKHVSKLYCRTGCGATWEEEQQHRWWRGGASGHPSEAPQRRWKWVVPD